MNTWARDYRSHTPCYNTGTKVASLRIRGCHVSRQSYLHWLAEELVSLSGLFLAVSEIGGSVALVVWTFGVHLRRGTLRSVQVAVSGEWEYDVNFAAGVEEAKTYERSCVGAMPFAAGRVGGKGKADWMGREVKVGQDYPGVKRVVRRVLSAEE